MRNTRTWFGGVAVLATVGTIAALSAPALQPSPVGTARTDSALPLATGKRLTPQGRQTDVGSFPCNLALSPDGRYVLVTTAGSREYLSVLRADDGRVVSQIDWNGPSPVFKDEKQALYYGLACGKAAGGKAAVYASRGGEGTVSVLSLGADGALTDTGKTLGAPGAFLAGLALSPDGSRLYAADNRADPARGMRSVLNIVDTGTNTVPVRVDVPGYPFAVAALANGQKVYVSSEQRGKVSVVYPVAAKTFQEIATGAQPMALALDRAQRRLFVANAGSDTVSIVDTHTDRVIRTLLLRPDSARGLPGATPTGLALAPDEKRLYVTLGDMNAVAVVELPKGTLAGYIPVGWYPTAAVVSPDGRRLFVANAKGVAARNPNSKPVAGLTSQTQYIQNIIEGTVSMLDLTALPALKTLTAQTLANNRGRDSRATPLMNPGIKHVFYIIKENRTYDQILGDLPQGDGDPAICLFPREVTPNQHALAERFALLDNFYCCAEVSGDGWNWSTGAMASEYVERNVPHNYGGRERPYDFEGTNNGIAVDRIGVPDAARPPGGYLWDLCAAHGVSFRNYGFFTDDLTLPRTVAEAGTKGLQNSPTKKALIGENDADFREFDASYADSEAWVKANIAPAPKQMTSYGTFRDPSRVTAWKREFAGYVKEGNLPQLSLLRVMRDHTAGTTAGHSSARAMVADNDYAVGQIVETISHSPYWKSSAIVVVEDDAQNGYDHVDAHRSPCYVISPFIDRATHDSHFYNTDSALRTIERLLDLPPMTQYDAIAPAIDVFGKTTSNSAPYEAIMPAREIIAEVNGQTAYRAADSALLLNPHQEESAPDEELNDILWHSIKGNVPAPQRRYSLRMGSGEPGRD